MDADEIEIAQLEAQKDQLEAVISHLKSGGGENYDSAPEHVFIDKPSPSDVKSSSQVLSECEDSLREVENSLNQLYRKK